MVKLIQDIITTYQNIPNKKKDTRLIRHLVDLDKESNNLIRDFCQWYDVDNHEEITLLSTNLLRNIESPEQYMSKHLVHYNNVNSRLQRLLNKKEMLLHNYHKGDLRNNVLEPLNHLEVDLAYNLNRMLHFKRRKQLHRNIRIERQSEKAKVHNFTTKTIGKGLMTLLNKGPSTIPRVSIPLHKRQQECKAYLTDVLRQTVGCYSKQPKLTPIGLEVNRPGITPTETINAEDNLEYIQEFLTNIPEANNQEEKHEVMTRLHTLGKDKDIIINTADKNIGFSINTTSWYAGELKRQLSDRNTYIEIINDTNTDLIETSKNNLKKLIERIEYINDNTPTTAPMDLEPLRKCMVTKLKLPSLNLLPKVHKLKAQPNPNNESELKGRPILNGFNFTTSPVSRVFDTYMNKITNKLENLFDKHNLSFPCLTNSDELINSLQSMPILKLQDITQMWIITFDFESLYTNVTKEYVYSMLKSALTEKFITITEHGNLKSLYDFMQDNNIFHVGHERYFRQINGLSMGSYDAQDTSNNVLLFREFILMLDPVFKRYVQLYKRYIDDGFAIVLGDITAVHSVISLIAKILPTKIPIEFSIKKFRNHFLDLWVKLDHDSLVKKAFSYHIHQKELNTYTYTHRTSDHPRFTFHGIVQTENIRYDRKSSSFLERKHIGKLFNIRLNKQGYKEGECRYNRKVNRTRPEFDARTKKIIKIKFCQSHGLNIATNKIIKKAKYHRNRKLMTVHTNNKKLKEILLTKKKLHTKISRYLE